MHFMSINKHRTDAGLVQLNKSISLHREWARQQHAAGILAQAGKWGDRGGMIVVRAETREEADTVVNLDPLAQSGLITFETARLHTAAAFK